MLLEVMSPLLVDHLERNFTSRQVQTVVGAHLTTAQAAHVFARTSPRLGVYYHSRNDKVATQTLVTETRKYYGGPLLVAYDLLQIVIGTQGISNIDRTPSQDAESETAPDDPLRVR
jgi:hypothetical protein